MRVEGVAQLDAPRLNPECEQVRIAGEVGGGRLQIPDKLVEYVARQQPFLDPLAAEPFGRDLELAAQLLDA